MIAYKFKVKVRGSDTVFNPDYGPGVVAVAIVQFDPAIVGDIGSEEFIAHLTHAQVEFLDAAVEILVEPHELPKETVH